MGRVMSPSKVRFAASECKSITTSHSLLNFDLYIYDLAVVPSRSKSLFHSKMAVEDSIKKEILKEEDTKGEGISTGNGELDALDSLEREASEFNKVRIIP